MLLPAVKLGIGVGTPSALAAGVYGVVYLVDNSVRSLHDTGEYPSSQKGSDRFGDEFSYYFLATKDNSNAKVWSARARALRRHRQEDNTDEFFKQIKKNKDGEDLRDVCAQKYSEAFPTSNMTKWKGVWIYCSIGGMRPKTIEEAKHADESKYTKNSEADTSNNSFGKTLKNELISTKDPDNQWFWKLRQKEFKNGDLKTDPASSYFSTHTTETIQRMCERAYEMQTHEGTGTNTIPSKNEIKKYCSIRRIEKEAAK